MPSGINIYFLDFNFNFIYMGHLKQHLRMTYFCIRRLFGALLILCMAYNTALFFFMPIRTYKVLNTGSKRLFDQIKPPDRPHQIVSLQQGYAAVFIGDIHGYVIMGVFTFM